MNRVRMLIYFGVTPYLVFDGDNLPSKAATETERANKRAESKQQGLELYRKGKVSQANQELQKAIDVTPFMARQLIDELKRAKVQYVVAPYEADAQLAYLERKGIIDGILSEDSDLLVFGAKRLLTKLDQHGDCVEINRADFTSCRDISLLGWTDADFRRMAILSGCDYLPNIPKMGLKTAYRYVRKYKSVDKVLRMLQFEGHFSVPADYLENFNRAELTFLHHRVFCPVAQKLVMITDLDRDAKEEDLPFLGVDVTPEVAIGVACGDLDPMTKQPIVICSPMSSRAASFNSKRQTIGSQSELKSIKPINSFFQPKRTPLAELDPNSLAQSPTQQRLLEAHAGQSWEASPVPQRSHLRRTTSSLPEPGPDSRAMRSTERVDFLARAATLSSYQPPKRQRLCSETESDALLTPQEIKRSPFFEAGPTPSNQKTKKAKNAEFGIFSDDSVEEILIQLPDVAQSTEVGKLKKCVATRSTIPVQDETASGGPEMASRAESNVAIPASRPLSRKPDSASVMAPVTSAVDASQVMMSTFVSIDSDPQRLESLFQYHAAKLNESTRALSSSLSKHQSATEDVPSSIAESEATVGPESSLPRPRSPSTALHTPVPESASQSRSLTPLQRLGRNALSRSQSTHSLKKGSTSLKRPPRTSDNIEYGQGVMGSEGDGAERRERIRGSEDLIVPNSEDEEDAGTQVDVGTAGRLLNLERFTFTPR